MSNSKDMDVKVKFGLKSFITVVVLLFVVLIAVGALTYIIPAGKYLTFTTDKELAENDPFYVYTIDESLNKQIVSSKHYTTNKEFADAYPEYFEYTSVEEDNAKPVPNTDIDSYTVLTDEQNSSRLAWWRWILAPFEAIILGSTAGNEIVIIVLLLVLGGTFKVLESSGGLVSLVRILIEKLHKKRFLMIWVITLVIMILSAVFGLQEQLLILYPVFAMLCVAMNWSKFTAISFVLISSGVGFTTAITNPLTVGMASAAAGTALTDGMGYRLIIFAVMYVVTSLFLVALAKRDEAKATDKFDIAGFTLSSPEEHQQDIYKAKMIVTLFGIALFAVIVASVINLILPKPNATITMVAMAVAFIVGTVVIGKKLLGSFKEMGKQFLSGLKDVAPSIVIIMVAFGITYIASQGNIMHTIFHYFHSLVTTLNPYVSILLMYLLILIVEFFIPSASAKAVLIIPMLTVTEIAGISKSIIILTYLFADGYANVLFPTCGTLLVGLGLADVSYSQWFKKTILFQLLLMAMSLGFLMLAIALGL